MYVIILAGGLGLRLRPLTNRKPKPMVEILRKPILEYQIEWLKSQGVDNFVIACGYKHEKIVKYFGDGEKLGVRIQYSVEKEKLGTGGGIKQALNYVDENEEDIIVTNGDIITTIDLKPMVEYHKETNFMATMLLVPFKSPYGIVDVDETNRIRGFREKPELPYWINGGVYIIKRNIVDFLPDRGDIEKETFPVLAEKGLLGSYKSRGFWRAIDTIKDLSEIEDELKKLLMKVLLEKSRKGEVKGV